MLTRRRLLVPTVGLLLVLAYPPGARAASAAVPDRQVLLIVVPDLAYADALADPTLSPFAGAGGLGLMTTSGGADDPARTAVNVGAGASAEDAPTGAVPFEELDGGIQVEVAPYIEGAGDAIPGLLGSTLADADFAVGYLDFGSSSGDVALLSAMDRDGLVPSAAFGAIGIDGALTSDAVAIVNGANVIVAPDPAVVPLALEATGAGQVLVVVVGAGATSAMHDRGDAVAPILVARGSPDELLAGDSGPTGLSSSTTRRDGVVSDIDVAPTILDFLGVPTPDEMAGSPIEPSGEAPTDLHERSLVFHRVVGPVGMVILWLALGSLAAALVLILVTRSPAGRAGRWIGLAMLSSLALLVATVPASTLPSFTWPVVIGYFLVVGSAVVAFSLWRGRRDPRAAVATVAVLGLVAIVIDGALGWPSQLTPFLGGGVFDGERFFGLGNAHAGILLAGALLGAARLSRTTGVWLIAAAAAFAGLPFLGADLGGSVTLAIAAALWFGLGRWGGLGWRTWALATVVALGTAILVIVADRVLPGGHTHLSTVSQGGVLGAFVDRLAANAETTSANASAWLAVLGLPVWAIVAWRRPARFRATLEPDPRWRDAIVVLAIAGIAGYLLNDTYGLAGSAFAFASAAMLYPILAKTPDHAASSAD